MSNSDGANAGTDNNGTTPPGNDPTGNAGAGTTPPAQQGDKTFTQADIDRVVTERLARERQRFADYDDLKNKASKFDEYQQSQMSDLEKANEAIKAKDTALAEAQTRLAEMEVQSVRSAAATAAGLPAELHQFITATDPDEAKKQAETLASKLTPATPQPGAIPQGARPGAQAQPDMNQWLRARAFGG